MRYSGFIQPSEGKREGRVITPRYLVVDGLVAVAP
jgi:hypothetical protein